MKRNVMFALAMGILTGIFLIPTLQNNDIQIPYKYFVILAAYPIAAAAGIMIASFVGSYVRIIFQLAKFVLSGVLSASIDFGVLNILIVFTGVASGIGYSIFKSLSFIIANINSYYWNRAWTFEEKGVGQKGEYIKFFIVSIGGFFINVGVASLAVNYFHPLFGLNLKQWANMGAVFGAIAGLFWNFVGYKFIVFKS